MVTLGAFTLTACSGSQPLVNQKVTIDCCTERQENAQQLKREVEDIGDDIDDEIDDIDELMDYDMPPEMPRLDRERRDDIDYITSELLDHVEELNEYIGDLHQSIEDFYLENEQ